MSRTRYGGHRPIGLYASVAAGILLRNVLRCTRYLFHSCLRTFYEGWRLICHIALLSRGVISLRDGYTLCRFYETDLPLQQLVQEAQLAANVMEAYLHQRIVMAFESLVGLPVHAFGFAAVAIQDASLPAHAFA